MPRPSLEERFWKNVNKTESCWHWIGYKSKRQGYGQIRRDGPSLQAHRVSWIIHFGEIPNGLLVCHKCDNPSCVRPDHLFLGTQKDNVADCVQKGRAKHWQNLPENRAGENNGRAKLTPQDVIAIRQSSSPVKEIATQYGINDKQIYRIRARKAWKHV